MEQVLHIINRILDGDRTAERQLYDLFRKKWYMLALRYSSSRDEANDMMQEGLIQIYKDLHQYDANRAQFSTWSSRVMVNASLRYLKKNNWNNTLLGMPETEKTDEGEENIYDQLAAKELTMMVQQLPMGYRLVFNMAVIEGYKHQEIADHLGITVGTSKSQLSKAKRMLRSQLEQQIKAYPNG